MNEIVFTGRELDVMAVLWEQGASTVADVRARLEDSLAYTTVLTVLRTLEAKGHVTHESDGKAHHYSALVARDAAALRETLLARAQALGLKGTVLLAEEGLNLFLEILIHDTSLDFQRGRQLAVFDRERARKDRELLDRLGFANGGNRGRHL